MFYLLSDAEVLEYWARESICIISSDEELEEEDELVDIEYNKHGVMEKLLHAIFVKKHTLQNKVYIATRLGQTWVVLHALLYAVNRDTHLSKVWRNMSLKSIKLGPLSAMCVT